MSRERKQRREARHQATYRWYTRIFLTLAAAEGRRLNSIADLVAYVEELLERGVVVDKGPVPGCGRRHITFRLDKVPALQDGNSLSSIADLIRKGI